MRHTFQATIQDLKKQGQQAVATAKSEHKKHPYFATGALASLTLTLTFGFANGVYSIADENTREDFMAWAMCSQKQEYNIPCSANERAAHAIIEPQMQRKAYAGAALSLIAGIGAGALHRRRLRQAAP